MDYVLGIDGGGSKTKAVIADLDGNIVGKGAGGPSNYQFVGLDQAVCAIEESIAQAKAKADISDLKFKAACFGLSGVGREIDRLTVEKALKGSEIAEKIVLDHDAAIALAGATVCRPGVVIIAGTGAMAFGMDEDGRRERAGGWGAVLGDEGGGYYIGHRVLVSACRAYDGRGDKTLLVDKLVGYFRLPCFTDMVKEIYSSDSMARQKIASLVPLVVEAADEGDAVADKILREAGEELGVAATAVIRKLNMQDERFEIARIGGVFNAGARILVPFENVVKKVAPYAELISPEFEPEIGAALLALKKIGVKLSSRVIGAIRDSLEGM